MAVYKVPQDVEADDKLIGPFSFRQFIYLIIVAISGAAAWGLSQLFILLAIIPLPFIIFFAALALPLRKDQPMETYLSAVVSFYFLKSRRRFWLPDGIDSFVTIIPPKNEDVRRTKDLNEDEATKRLGYLADLVDSHGWSVRGSGVPAPENSINTDLYYESQADDMMDTNNAESERLTRGLAESSAQAHEAAKTHMREAEASLTQAAVENPLLANAPVASPATTTPDRDQYDPATPFTPVSHADQPVPTTPFSQSIMTSDNRDAVTYAKLMAEEAEEKRHEDALRDKPPQSTSITTTPDDTMEHDKKRAEELASRDELTIETIGKEAERMKKQEQKALTDGDEVTISFR